MPLPTLAIGGRSLGPGGGRCAAGCLAGGGVAQPAMVSAEGVPAAGARGRRKASTGAALGSAAGRRPIGRMRQVVSAASAAAGGVEKMVFGLFMGDLLVVEQARLRGRAWRPATGSG